MQLCLALIVTWRWYWKFTLSKHHDNEANSTRYHFLLYLLLPST